MCARWLPFPLITTVVLLVGCSLAPGGPVPAAPEAKAPPSDASGPDSRPATQQPQPKRGGIAKYLGKAGPSNLHPYPIAAFGQNQVLGPVYETLLAYQSGPDVDYTQNFETIPWLAESWEQLNRTTLLFRIRKGINWQDGAEFTAADVKFSYDYARDPVNKFVARRFVDDIAEIELVDPYTVRVLLDKPSVTFLEDLADFNMMVLPKHVLDRGDAFEKVAIGTGPYKLKEYSDDKAAVYTRNEKYWQAGKPYPSGLEIVYGLEPAAEFAAFITRNLDLIHLSDRPQADQVVQQAAGVEVIAFMGQIGTQWLLKVDSPPFNDERVRRAVHLAVDRQGLNRSIAAGDGMPQPPLIPPHKAGWAIPQEDLLKLPGYRQPKAQDLAEAKRLLAEAGYPQGLKVSVTYSKSYLGGYLHSEPLAGQLRQAGIDLNLQILTGPDYLAREARGDYESIFSTNSSVKLDRARDYLHTKGRLNKLGVSDPTVDRLLEDMATLPEPGNRQKAALEVQRYLLDKLYLIPLLHLPVYHVHQPWVRDHAFNRGNNDFIFMLNAARTWLDVDMMPANRRS